jgi:hypothetical protein
MFWPGNGTVTFLKKRTGLSRRYRVLVYSEDYKRTKIAEEFEKYKTE